MHAFLTDAYRMGIFAGMSRPALPVAARKSKCVYLLVTPSERREIEDARKKAGKSTVSDWLREIVKKELASD